MSKYELVCVIDAGAPSSEIKATQENIEKTVSKKSILATDQMWLMPLAYPLNWNDQWYFLSYHVEIDPARMEEIKVALRLEKGLAKFVFYKMGDHEKFLTFADLQKSFEEQWPKEPEKTVRSASAEPKSGDVGTQSKTPVVDHVPAPARGE